MFYFLTRINIGTVHLTSHGSPYAFSLNAHTSHKTTSDLLLSLFSLSSRRSRVSWDLSPDPFESITRSVSWADLGFHEIYHKLYLARDPQIWTRDPFDVLISCNECYISYHVLLWFLLFWWSSWRMFERRNLRFTKDFRMCFVMNRLRLGSKCWFIFNLDVDLLVDAVISN